MVAIAASSAETGIHNATRDILPRSSDEAGRMTGSVLIVDDDQSMADTLTKAMTRRGFVVTSRTSSQEALKLL